MFVLFINLSLTHTFARILLVIAFFCTDQTIRICSHFGEKNSIVTKCAFIVDTFKPIGDRVFVKYSLSELYICISFTSILNHRSWKSKTKSICNNQISNQNKYFVKKRIVVNVCLFRKRNFVPTTNW